MPDKSAPQSPADIAREAFKRIAARRIAPTPDTYRTVYYEIAGITEAAITEETATTGRAGVGDVLDGSTQQHAKSETKALPAARSAGIPLVDEVVQKPKSAAIPLIAEPLSQPVVPRSAAMSSSRPDDSLQIKIMRDLLARLLSQGVGALVQDSPELQREIDALIVCVRDAYTAQSLNDTESRLKQLCFKLELRIADAVEERKLLLRLFNLLLDNVGELLEDDTWLRGQVEGVQELLAGPLSHKSLLNATRSLKEVIYKQGALKHSLADAKNNMKSMMIIFIDRLGAVASSTGAFHQKMNSYAEKIGKAKGIGELGALIQDVMLDARITQAEALRSRDDMLAARREVQNAEIRIQELEAKLVELSELVMEDALTGGLNRRGLDEVLQREIARAGRSTLPLSIALLDLDDLKRLNNDYGDAAGDGALAHLVAVIKDTLRSMDVIARFDGEKLMIVLPDTSLENASQVVIRVQRELTKRIFLHNNERLLMTFSAGLALWEPGEEPTKLIERADLALFKAKRAGKNRVVTG